MKPTPQLPLDYDHGSVATQQLTAAILAYLDAHGFEAWAQPNRGEYDPNTGRWRPHPNSRRGVSDILGYRRTDGRFLACEVKFGKDRLRDEQIVFLNQVKAAGALAFVAHTLAGFIQSFERRGLHLPMATPAAHITPSTPYQTTLPIPSMTDNTPATYTSLSHFVELHSIINP